jgi:hypothetical protein
MVLIDGRHGGSGKQAGPGQDDRGRAVTAGYFLVLPV